MPTSSPRFWLEVVILGFVLVLGMTILTTQITAGWGTFARVAFVAVIFTVYGRYYNQKWGQ